jgi:hypothetical protein
MAKTRPPYSPEFRRQLVELVRAPRTWHGSSNRRRSRSRTGLGRLSAPLAAAPPIDLFLASLRTAWKEGGSRPTDRPILKVKRGRRRPDRNAPARAAFTEER